jgi:hypothetical protein
VAALSNHFGNSFAFTVYRNRRNSEMFWNIGQKFVSWVPLENNNVEEEPVTASVNQNTPVDQQPKPVSSEALSSMRAELQFNSLGLKVLLQDRFTQVKGESPAFNRIADKYGVPAEKLFEIPLENPEGPEAIDDKNFKPASLDIYTGSGNDQVVINKGDDNLVHINVNGTEVWSGSEDAFRELNVDTGDGDDYVINTVDGANIYTRSGNDKVENSANDTQIYTENGDDEVRTQGNSNGIDTEVGNDIVRSTGNNNDFFTRNGDDLVQSEGDVNLIVTSDGDDTVQSTGSNGGIFTGVGNDLIDVVGNKNEIESGAQNDIIRLKGDHNKIDGGEGLDSITVDGNQNSISDND